MVEEEEIVGRAGDPNDGINVISSTYRRFRCNKCNKNHHCIAGYQKDSKAPELLKDRCSNKDCECICRTHYMGRDGRMRKYGKKDDSFIDEIVTEKSKRNETDDLIDKLNAKFRKKEEKKNVQVL